MLHQSNWNIIIHFNHSESEAFELESMLNQSRLNSAKAIQADLNYLPDIQILADQSFEEWQRIDAVIHNASSFFPTPLGTITEDNWNLLVNSNFKAPLFLTQALLPALKTIFRSNH